MFEPSGHIPLNLICVVLLGALGLRKLIRMESHHEVRVVILTGCLWALAIYLFVVAFLPSYPSCVPGHEEPCAYSCVLH